MARSAAIPLGFGAVGAILLISGIQNETIGEVIKGEFGKGTKHETPNPSEAETTGSHGEGQFQNVANRGAEQSLQASGSFGSPTEPQHESVPGGQLAPSPRQVGAHAVQQAETQAVYNILQKRGIAPGRASTIQVNEAREQYAREKAIAEGR